MPLSRTFRDVFSYPRRHENTRPYRFVTGALYIHLIRGVKMKISEFSQLSRRGSCDYICLMFNVLVRICGGGVLFIFTMGFTFAAGGILTFIISVIPSICFYYWLFNVRKVGGTNTRTTASATRTTTATVVEDKFIRGEPVEVLRGSTWQPGIFLKDILEIKQDIS